MPDASIRNINETTRQSAVAHDKHSQGTEACGTFEDAACDARISWIERLQRAGAKAGGIVLPEPIRNLPRS